MQIELNPLERLAMHFECVCVRDVELECMADVYFARQHEVLTERSVLPDSSHLLAPQRIG